MRPSLAVVFPLLCFICLVPLSVASGPKSTCNYVTLVRCFINILDEWAWTLYELKDNVVTITSEQCKHLRELDKCIKDDISTDVKHACSHAEVVEVSNTVSDLLTHRKNSGSFLKSYYLLTYACSEQGQEVLLHHRECLRNEKIGEMTLLAGTYLSEKFLDDGDDDEACDLVNTKIQEYVHSMNGLCENDAAQIMCESLKNMFKGLHADKLGDCDLTCNIERNDPEPLPVEETTVVASQIPGDSASLGGDPTDAEAASARSLAASFAPLLAAAALLRP